MTMPELSSSSAWIALGVQHAVLARAMPAVRHDLAAPLSVMRMGTTVLKRRLADGELPPAQAVERVEQLETHLASLTDSARRLRHWDLQAPPASAPLRATAQLAQQWAQPLLALRGLAVELADGGDTLPDTPAAQHLLLCLLLGAVHILAEAPAAPACIRIGPVPGQANALRVQAEGLAHQGLAEQSLPAPQAQGMPPLDGAALQHLARHGGADLRWGDGWVEVTAP